VEAGKPIRFNGQGFSLMGEKGRFVLPPDIRKTLKESGEGERVMCLIRHPKWKCLSGFGLSRVERFDAEIEREYRDALEQGRAFDRDLRYHQLNGFARIPFDDSGRFVLPERYFRLGALGEQIYFHGGGPHFTLWNPDELARMGAGWEDAQEACLDLQAAALAGKGRK